MLRLVYEFRSPNKTVAGNAAYGNTLIIHVFRRRRLIRVVRQTKEEKSSNMKTVLVSAVAFLTVGSCMLAADAVKLPQAAKAALAKMDQDIEKAKNAAIVVLKKALQEETRKGNLPIANMIQARIDELSAPTSVVGRWKQDGTPFVFEIKDGGDVDDSGGNRGKWTANRSTLSCVFPHGTWTLDLPPRNGVVKGMFSNGIKGSWTKLP